MDMVPYILAGIPLAIALRLGIWSLAKRARRRKNLAEWDARMEQLRGERDADLVKRFKQIDGWVADGILGVDAAEELKEQLRQVSA